MAYRIEAGEKPEVALRRIAREEVKEAIAEIDAGEDLHQTVHEVRKHCKKLRGLIRLFRPTFPAYSAENTCFRDEARRLSEVRDATSLIECCDGLAGRFAGDRSGEPIARVRETLTERRASVISSLDIEERMDAIRKGLDAAADRVEGWSLESSDGFGALGSGLGRVYKRAREAMGRVRQAPTTENLHEWRKRVKYHRYHLRLLRGLWPPVMTPLRDSTKLLSDRLGDDHDLAVLRETLVEETDGFEAADRRLLLGLIDCRRKELQAWSLPLGEQLLGEKTSRFRQRMGCYWDAWTMEQGLASALAEGSNEVT
jgi:CHAD domain-containing protein